MTVSTIGGGSEPFEGLWSVSCLSPMEFWGTKTSLFYGQSQWGRDDRGLHWRKFINKILLFPLKIPTPLLGVIKLICRFSSTSVPSAERRLCRFYFSIYCCTHENKIVWKWSVSSHKIRWVTLEKILKIKKRLVGGDENLQIIWWALPDKVTIIEGNSVHRLILRRITHQRCTCNP